MSVFLVWFLSLKYPNTSRSKCIPGGGIGGGGQNVLRASNPKISQGAKCHNTLKLYTTYIKKLETAKLISIIYSTEMSKTQFFPDSIVKLFLIMFNWQWLFWISEWNFNLWKIWIFLVFDLNLSIARSCIQILLWLFYEIGIVYFKTVLRLNPGLFKSALSQGIPDNFNKKY